MTTHFALGVKLRRLALIDPDGNSDGMADDDLGLGMFVCEMNPSRTVYEENQQQVLWLSTAR